jgi:hypothetical protein
MSARRHLVVSATIAAALLAVALPTTASATAATKITACVKTKTGVARVLTVKQAKKKCPKGSKKVTWSVKGTSGANGKNGVDGTTTNGKNGANGSDGPAGTSGVLQVHDSAGNPLGAYAGAATAGAGTLYTVLSPDGGLYRYSGSGQLVPDGSPVFLDPGCAGTAYLYFGQLHVPALGGIGVAGRYVYRPYTGLAPQSLDFGVVGPARAWKFSDATIPWSGGVYLLDQTGACVQQPGMLPAGFMLAVLTSIPAPPDGAGPIVVG